MKKVLVGALLILAIGAVFYVMQINKRTNNVPAGNAMPTSGQITTQHNKRSQPIDYDSETLSSTLSKANTNNSETVSLTEAQALEGLEILFDNIAYGDSPDFAFEKQLISYLGATNNQRVYDLIMEKLNTLTIGERRGDRVMEYMISLLVAVDSTASVALMLGLVETRDWQGSEAVYLVKKSITHASQGGKHTELFKRVFSGSSDKSPFLNELAEGVAQNDKPAQVDYLFTFVVEEQASKSVAAAHALGSLTTESLVPQINNYVYDESLEKQAVALRSLAYMGQYEAAHALIKWSASQPTSANKEVKALLDIAARRSPSTARAIKKESAQMQFASNEIRTLVFSYSEE